MAAMRGVGWGWIVAYWQVFLAITGSVSLIAVMLYERTEPPFVGVPPTWERPACE